MLTRILPLTAQQKHKYKPNTEMTVWRIVYVTPTGKSAKCFVPTEQLHVSEMYHTNMDAHQEV